MKAQERADGWVITPLRLVVVPYSLMAHLVKREHDTVHWGTEFIEAFTKVSDKQEYGGTY